MIRNVAVSGVRCDRRRFLDRLGRGALVAGGFGAWGPLEAALAAAQPAPHFAPRAKRVICLFQSGGPSQLDLFDAKPLLARWHGTELPASVRGDQRLTGMTANQSSRPVTASLFSFARHGEAGIELSELLPHTASVADELCLVRSLQTEAINHDPAVTFFQTGSQQPGRPSIGAWLSYCLATENRDLPAFVVLISGGQPGDQPLFGRLWSAGFLPPEHQGVRFRGTGDPVLYLRDPPGVSPETRVRILDLIERFDRRTAAEFGDPETTARIAQFRLAHRMQTSVPELTDIAGEPAHVLAAYGPDAERPGSYARNCLLARRMAERGVRFIQLYHRGWDHHDNLPANLRRKCLETDQPSAALVRDLKQRGLLDDTLVLWCGEFGRTVYCQGTLTPDNYGRDHHPRCFAAWLAGGGIRSGQTIGRTDDFSYNVVADPIHVHDLQATLLHCLGFDHERLTFRFQGRDFRLTDVHGHVVPALLR